MKIGILTLPLHTNYGGILQAWALQTVLRRMGHEVETFMPKKKGCWKEKFYFLKRIILKCAGYKMNVPIFIEYTDKNNKINRYINRFIKKKIKIKFVKTLSNIAENKYNAIVVGSDQVWRKKYFEDLWQAPITDAFLYLSTKEKSIKLSFAASFGVNEWQFDEEESFKISEALKSFKGVSVRERDAVELIKEKVGMNTCQVLDPTLLLNDDDYLNLLGIKREKSEGITSYILDPSPEIEKFINEISEQRKLKRKELNVVSSLESKISIKDWIKGFAEAEMVVTDSFHGCVFSIIFRKPFLCIGNEDRGSARFDSLIETFGLQKNFIKDTNNFDNQMDYSLPKNIDEKISQMMELSFSFINNSLNN